MRLTEIMPDDEPLIIKLIRGKLAKGQIFVRYIRQGDRVVRARVERFHHNAAHDNTKGEWVFFTRVGFGNLFNFRFSDDEMDKLDLLPGKVKNTFQIKRHIQKTAVNESRGSETLDFIAWLDSAGSSRTLDRSAFEQMGADLFRRGWAFHEQISCFTKKDKAADAPSHGEWQLLLPKIDAPRNKTKDTSDSSVTLTYHGVRQALQDPMIYSILKKHVLSMHGELLDEAIADVKEDALG